MNLLAISGLPNNKLDALFDNLIFDTEKSQKNNHLFNQKTLSFHQQVLDSFAQNNKLTEQNAIHLMTPQLLNLGEMRIQQGAQLLLSHSNEKLLAWSDPYGISLLEFWQKLEPDINYLLTYQSPWTAIDYLFQQYPDPLAEVPGVAAKLWLDFNKKLLQFYNKNKTHCLLINTDFISEQMQELSHAMSNKLSIHLQSSADKNITSAKKNATDKNTLYLLNQNMPELLDFYMEMESQADLLNRVADFSWQDELEKTPQTADIFSYWFNQTHTQMIKNKKLQESEALIILKDNTLKQKQAELEAEQKDMNALQQQNNELKKSLEQSASQLQKLKAEIQSKEDESKEQEQENKLLLLQLHQVQEELETHFLHNKENEAVVSSLKQKQIELDAKNKENESEIRSLKKSKELSASQLQKLKAEIQSKEDESKEQEQENELLLLQLHQVQEELEHYFLLNQESYQLIAEYSDRLNQARQLLIHFAKISVEKKNYKL